MPRGIYNHYPHQGFQKGNKWSFKKGNVVWNKNIKETHPEVIEKLRKSHLGKTPWNIGIREKNVLKLAKVVKE